MIHGFSGSNEEFKDLEEFFAKKGIIVRAPMLLGHGTTPEDLLQTSPTDWEEQMDRELDNFTKEVDKFFLGGISFGGNLAIHFARNRKNIDGLILLGTVIWFYNHRLIKALLPVFKIFKSYYKKRINPKHFFEKEAIGRRRAYPIAPVKNLIELLQFVDDRTKKELPDLKIPALILHSLRDAVINPKSADYIYKNIGSEKRELCWVDNSHHNLVIDKPRIKVFQTMHDFMIKNGAY